MSIVRLDTKGNKVVTSKGVTIVEKVKTIKSRNKKKGLKTPSCINDILETEETMREDVK